MEYFTHLVPYGLLVCKECQYGVLPSQVTTHLAGPQHQLPARQRREIRDVVATWPGLLQTDVDFKRVGNPRDRPRRLEALALHSDGKMCHLCGHIVRTRDGIQAHYRREHGVRTSWASGLSGVDGRNPPWAEGVHCQRFFTHGAAQGYFEVQAPDESDRDAKPTVQKRPDSL